MLNLYCEGSQNKITQTVCATISFSFLLKQNENAIKQQTFKKMNTDICQCVVSVLRYIKLFIFKTLLKKRPKDHICFTICTLHRMDIFTKYFIINARFPSIVSMDCLKHVSHEREKSTYIQENNQPS